jgi:pimeloyl-ACP methyl ester carboxylesterase
MTSTANRARIRELSHDGLTFDVLDDGPLEGEAVVLLHGFPERASHWNDVAAILHEHGLRTLAPDQRGYSPRARPRSRLSYRLSHLVADIVALIDEYGAPVHLVGHDWGAMVAWATAARHPERVQTLTTVSVPHPAAFARSLTSSDQWLRSWYFLPVQPPFLVEGLARSGMLERWMSSGGLGDAEVERFRTEIVEYGALPGALGWYRALPFSWRYRTGRVRVPTTHVWSDRDPALARGGAELTEQFVLAPYELVVLEGVSHWVPTHAPQALAEAIVARVESVAP